MSVRARTRTAIRSGSGLVATDGVFRSVLTKSLTLWIREGKVRYREDIVDGFANTPDALRGENFGKLIIRVQE
jgi:NADPH-dependent curcumin reductase